MTKTFDFAVIGAGIAGISAAYELAAHGSVVVLEQEETTGYHTTSRSAATWVAGYGTKIERILTKASREHLVNPPTGFTNHSLTTPLPVMLIARSDQIGSLDAIATDTYDPGLFVRLDSGEAMEACPALRDGYLEGALIEQESFEIDVHALNQGFLKGMRRRGGEIHTAFAVSKLDKSGSIWHIESRGRAIEAQVVVNAAGAWCDQIAIMAGIDPCGLIPYRRTAFAFSPPPEIATGECAMVVDVDEKFYFKPEGSLFMGSLAEETPMRPHDVRPEEDDVALAIDRINAATTFNIRHVLRTWAGLRTFATDRHPLVGFDPRTEGFFWLAGQGGFGVMTSPAIARLSAGIITGAGIPDDLATAGLEYNLIAPDRLIT